MSIISGFLVREVATVNVSPILIPRFMNIVNNSFGGAAPVTNFTRPNWTSSIFDTLMIYPDAIGVMAYLIITLIPFSMMWISNGNMKMAAVVGLLVGGFVMAFLPATYVTAAYICITISIVSGIWGLVKQ
jgi:hypothetical protein